MTATDTAALLRAMAESQAERDKLEAKLVELKDDYQHVVGERQRLAVELQQARDFERGTAPSDIRRHLHAVILIAEQVELWPVLRAAVDAYQALGGHDPALDDDVYIAMAEMRRRQPEPDCDHLAGCPDSECAAAGRCLLPLDCWLDAGSAPTEPTP